MTQYRKQTSKNTLNFQLLENITCLFICHLRNKNTLRNKQLCLDIISNKGISSSAFLELDVKEDNHSKLAILPHIP